MHERERPVRARYFSGATTFSWEAPGKVYACTEHWSKEHVNEVLTAAVRTHMPKHNVQITVE